MSNKNEVFEYLIDQLRQQVNNNPYKQQCEDLAHEVLSLKNQLRDASALVAELQSELQHQIDMAAGVYRWSTAYFDEKGKVFKVERGAKTEQSGCRKEDTQEWPYRFYYVVTDGSAPFGTKVCEQSGCRKEDTQECHHNWRFVNGKAPAVCVNCGVTKSSECEHEWQFYGVGFPCMCIKCGLKK